jgi:Bacterial SH3 domain
MKPARTILLAAVFALSPPAHASERGVAIRAGDIYAQPFTDAAKVGAVSANQPVTVLERKGGWLSVEVGGKRGWMRMLGVRLEAVARSAGPAALRTGSTGRTVATGVKGLDEGTIRAASVDRAQLARLNEMGASEADGRALAASNKLGEAKIAYLKPGKVK